MAPYHLEAQGPPRRLFLGLQYLKPQLPLLRQRMGHRTTMLVLIPPARLMRHQEDRQTRLHPDDSTQGPKPQHLTFYFINGSIWGPKIRDYLESSIIPLLPDFIMVIETKLSEVQNSPISGRILGTAGVTLLSTIWVSISICSL